MPEPITPEQLLFGRELVSLNVIPSLQPDYDEVYSPSELKDEYAKLRNAFKRLNEVYHEQFLQQLMVQSLDKRDRYKPVHNKVISPGDVCLLVESQTKRSNYPMAVVREVNINSLGEVTSAVLVKGKNRERVFRHATTLIPLLTAIPANYSFDETPDVSQVNEVSARPSTRNAALKAKNKITHQFDSGLV